MSVAELSQKLGISRASARRFMLTLEHLGYLSVEGRQYRLTAKVLGLGGAYFSSMPLSTLAQPHLEKLTKLSTETSSLGVLENNMLIFIARAQSKWIMNIGLNVGAQVPAYCTGMGRVILANMSEENQKQYLKNTRIEAFNDKTVTSKRKLMEIFAQVKRQGFSIVDQEIELGLRAIGVPVVVDGKVIASISISSQVCRANLKRMKEEFLPLLRDAAVAISSDMSYKY